MTNPRFFISFFILLFTVFCSTIVIAKEYPPIQWVDLIPKSDLDALLNPPSSLSDIPEGSGLDVISVEPLANSVEKAIADSVSDLSANVPSPEEQAYYAALKSTNVNPEYNKKNIRIPGFVVPVEYNENQVITGFFLVPYFGACIHVPPPPPNQIIYVKYSKGLSLNALYDPFWVEGQLLTEVIENDLAMSAYTIEADGVKAYDTYKP
ncbi:MAG: hypothetical protein ACJAUP_002263 [Cellvibrionaceae bacterium]|jgi:hypothetical protein